MGQRVVRVKCRGKSSGRQTEVDLTVVPNSPHLITSVRELEPALVTVADGVSCLPSSSIEPQDSLQTAR